jgi:hypothetical protein
MSRTRRFPQAIGAAVLGVLVAVVLAPGRARADENILRGPHPFLKDNELSVHALLVAGIGHTPGGTKIGADYGYRLGGPAWLNLQLNFQQATCHTPSGATTCDEPSGRVFETLAGAKLKWATPIPLVPYAKGGVGLAYGFPNGARNNVGAIVRGGGGATYFIFDWLGFGGEFAYSVGGLSIAGTHYAEIDVGGGLEFQF